MRSSKNQNKSISTQQLKIEFDSVRKENKISKNIGLVINLHEHNRQILTAQILKSTKRF